MPRLTGQAVIIGFGRLLNTAAASATLMVLARVLPDRESYGAICQLLMLYMILSQIFTAGIPQSIYYFLPRYENGERKGFMAQAMAILMGSGLVLGAGLFFGAELIGALLHSPLLPPLLRIFALYPFFMLPTVCVESAMLHYERPTAVVAFNMIARVGMFCSLVVPSLLTAHLTDVSVRLTIIMWSWVGMAGVVWLLAMVMIFSTVKGLSFTWRREMLREEWAFSMPLAVGNLLLLSGVYLDRFLISNLYGTDAFSIYNNATIVILTLGMVGNASSVVLTSEFSKRTSKGDYDSFLKIWNAAMMKAAVVLFAAMGFLAFWAHDTMSLLFSSRFAASGDILLIYVWSIPALLVIMQSLFVSMGATRMMLTITLVGLFLQVACVFGFYYLFGFYGIAVGAVVARFLGVIFGLHVFVKKVTNIGWKPFMPWIMLSVTLLTALSAGALSRVVILIPIQSLPAMLWYAIALVVFVVLYVGGLHLVRLLNYLIPVQYLPAKWYPRAEVKS
ncbi:MAG: lipopolysaccharide biosynthesis protein [Armatimonadota bacterium]